MVNVYKTRSMASRQQRTHRSPRLLSTTLPLHHWQSFAKEGLLLKLISLKIMNLPIIYLCRNLVTLLLNAVCQCPLLFRLSTWWCLWKCKRRKNTCQLFAVKKNVETQYFLFTTSVWVATTKNRQPDRMVIWQTKK